MRYSNSFFIKGLVRQLVRKDKSIVTSEKHSTQTIAMIFNNNITMTGNIIMSFIVN